MEGELGQWLTTQATVREDAKRRSWDRFWKVAMVAGPIYIFLLFLVPMEFPPKLWFGFFAGSAIWYWSQAPKREAVKQVKTGINEAIAEALDLKYAHDIEPGRGYELANSHKMLPHHTRENFEDCWAGNYAGHVFVLHEAHLEIKRGSGKNRRWVTVFRGSIISIGFSRNFHGTTLVSRKGTHTKLFGGDRDHIDVDGQRLDIVDMVHPSFEDAFVVYSSDQVEARYIVHPEYIERLIAIEKAFEGDDIFSLFHKGQLVITLNCGNLFESGSINARDDRAKVAQTIDQFARLADLSQSLQEPK